MKPILLLITQSLMIAGSGFSQTVLADSTQATCEFTRSGDRINNASGDCSFSQRQGNISITLRDGDTYELRSNKNSSGYTDQHGNKVEVRPEAGGTTQYKWNNKNIRVKFDGGSGDSPGPLPEGGGETGDSVRDLQDLVGTNANSGESELEKRGYKMKNSFTSGNSIYTHWRNHKSHQCIAVRVKRGEFKSLDHANDSDCKQSSSSDGGNSDGGNSSSGNANDLQDLVGINASSGENELERRGYKYRNSSKSGNSIYANWRNRNTKQCITVRIVKGEYRSIVDATDFDCKNND